MLDVIRVSMKNVVMKKYVAEAVGTMMLTLVVALALQGVIPVSVPVLAALTLGLFVYALGHVSGTHINPAITVGLWSIGRVSTNDMAKYVIAQVVGAGTALMIVSSLLVEKLPVTVSDSLGVGLAEMIGTALFAFGVAAVVFEKVPAAVTGMMIGTALLLGVVLAVLLGSNGVLNPAVALGIESFNIVYVLGPILGSVLGMNLYKWLAVDA